MKNKHIKQGVISLRKQLSTIFLGRKKENEDIFDSNISKSKKPIIWIHIGSWEKSEILQPVIKQFAKERKYTILVTYSSLSDNHNLRRDYDYIDYLFPLPANTDSKAEQFISFTQPSAVIFSTLPMYYNKYLCQLSKRRIPTFLIATKINNFFHYFFYWHDSSRRNAFKLFTHIFIFDNSSKSYLDKLGLNNVTINNYPPFDNIYPKDKSHYFNSIIMDRFINNDKFIFVGGNIDTDKDLKLVAHLANTNSSLKCILVPQAISEEHLDKIKFELDGFTLLYSECDENTEFSKVQNLVIDFIGNLSHIYRYGSCAYIGGRFTPYIHNITEAIACGLPISFRPQAEYRTLPKCLISSGVSQIVRTPDELYKWEKNLESTPALVNGININSIQFVENGIETSYKIFSHINSYL